MNDSIVCLINNFTMLFYFFFYFLLRVRKRKFGNLTKQNYIYQNARPIKPVTENLILFCELNGAFSFTW